MAARSRPTAALTRALVMALTLLLALPLGLATPVAAEEGSEEGSDASPEGSEVAVERFAGADRADTARLVAEDESPLAAGFAGRSVVLAREDDFPDGLAGSYVAGQLDAPLLLTQSDGLSSATEEALERLEPGQVVLMGGEAALSADLEEELDERFATRRVADDDRYGTAAQAAGLGGGERSATVLVASGLDFPDALVAGVAAAGERMPLLLATQDAVPEPTRERLEDLDPEEIVVVGGPAAIDEDVAEELEEHAPVTRLAGDDRQETARAVADWGLDERDWSPRQVALASGLDFPDALSVAPFAGQGFDGPAPLLLTAGDALDEDTAAWLDERDACTLAGVHLAGGEVAIPEAVEEQVRDAIEDDAPCEDEDPPELEILSPEDGEAVDALDAQLRIEGEAADDASGVDEITVEVMGEEAPVEVTEREAGVHRWHVDLTPQSSGEVEIAARATDRAGNEATERIEVDVDAPEDEQSVARPNVEVGSDRLEDALLEADDDQLRFDGEQVEAEELEPGTILALEATDVAPLGVLARIELVEDTGDEIVVETIPAGMVDAFAQVSIDVEDRVDPDQVAGGAVDDQDEPVEGSALGATAAQDEEGPTTVGESASVVSDPLTLTGALEGSVSYTLDPEIVFTLSIDDGWWFSRPEIEEFEFGVRGHESIAAEFAAELTAAESEEHERTLWDWELQRPIQVYPAGVPISISPRMELGLRQELEADAAAQASVSYERRATRALGLRYDGRTERWTQLEGRSPESIGPTVDIDVEGSYAAEVALQATASVSATGLVDSDWVSGPQVEPSATVEVALAHEGGIQATTRSGLEASWELGAEVGLEAGIAISLFSVDPPLFDEVDVGLEESFDLAYNPRTEIAADVFAPDPTDTIEIDGSPQRAEDGDPAVLGFEAAEGQRLSVGAAPDGDGCFGVEVRDEAWDQVTGEWTCAERGASLAFTVPDDGDHYLTVVADDTDVEVYLSESVEVEDAEGLTTVEAERPGQEIRLPFELEEAERFSVAASDIALPGFEDLADGSRLSARVTDSEDAALLSRTVVGDSTRLADTATFTGPAWASLQARRGTAGVRADVVVDGDQLGEIDVDGDPEEVDLPEPGTVAELDFEGSEGDRVTAEVDTSDFEGRVRVSVVDEDGDRVGSGLARSFARGDWLQHRVTLPRDGDYAVVVDPDDGVTGAGDLWLTSAEHASLSVGETTGLEIDRPGREVRYAIEVQDAITVSRDDEDADLGRVTLRLEDEAGDEVARGSMSSGRDRTLEPDQAGSHTLVVDPDAGETGGDTLSVQPAEED